MTRMQAAWAALGGDPGAYEIVIMQLVNLTEGGERVQMSKRAGAIVTLDDLVDDIGVDAARWFLASRSHDTTLDLDLELAPQPVAGQPRLLRAVRARADRVDPAQGGRGARGSRRSAADLRASSEQLPPVGARAGQAAARAARRDPRGRASGARRTGSTAYATETAQDFSAFYRDCRVVGAAEEGGDEDVRIAICVLAKRVLAQVARPARAWRRRSRCRVAPCAWR